MAGTSNEPVIIIKKRRKGGHEGHHGSAWKVAYADFVTAMMAFFLLLWLLNVTTDEQRHGIADYFDPGSVARSTSGSGGVLGGLTVGSPGQLSSPSSRFSLQRHLPGRPEASEGSNRIDEGSSDAPTDAPQDGGRHAGDPNANQGVSPTDGQRDPNAPTAAAIAAARAAEEQRQFEQAADALRQAIEAVPDLRELAQNLILEQTPEGMRIQIVDQEQFSMFPIGSSQMPDRTRRLLDLVARAVGQLPNRVSISGHTDSTPYASAGQYDNWDLSTDRANASRRALVAAGVPPARIETVIGRADTEPLFRGDTRDPRNRRISIVLLREAPLPAAGAGTGTGTAAPGRTAAAPGTAAGGSAGATVPLPAPGAQPR